MTSETASLLLHIAAARLDHGQRIPDHLRHDLQLVAMSDLPAALQSEARRLLEECGL